MDYELLSRSPVFRGLSSGETEGIIGTVKYRLRSYHPGTVIALSGEVVNSLMIVSSGRVKGEMLDFSGRVLKIEDIPAPRLIAPAFLFGSDNRFPVNVTAVDEVTLLIIEKSDFVSLLRRNEQVLINFLDAISNRSQFLSERIRFLAFRTIKGKIANFLLERTTSESPVTRMTLTQQELADFFGIARPSLARALKELEVEGYISSAAREIRVLDRKSLVELTRGTIT